jgi:hypothetical protein
MGLGKGKTKLGAFEFFHHVCSSAEKSLINFTLFITISVGIGKSTAEKIHEFYSTGAIQKLVEKRMINS